MSKSPLLQILALSAILWLSVEPAFAERFAGDGGGLKGIGGMGGGMKGIGGMGGGFKGIGGMGGGCKGLGGMGGGFRGVGDAGGGFSSLRGSGCYGSSEGGSWSGRYQNMDGGRYQNMDGGRYENMDGGRYGEGYTTSSGSRYGGSYSYSYNPAMEMAAGEAMLHRLRATHRTASFGGITQGTGPSGSGGLLQAVRYTDGPYQPPRVNLLNPDSMGGFRMYAK